MGRRKTKNHGPPLPPPRQTVRTQVGAVKSSLLWKTGFSQGTSSNCRMNNPGDRWVRSCAHTVSKNIFKTPNTDLKLVDERCARGAQGGRSHWPARPEQLSLLLLNVFILNIVVVDKGRPGLWTTGFSAFGTST